MSEQLTFDGSGEPIPRDPRTLARRDNPPTSKDAAAASAGRAGSDRRLCLGAHVRDPGGLTDDEVSVVTGLDLQAARRRCVDLRNLGLIEWLKRRDETGELVIVTRASSGGKRSGVCVLTPTGRIAGMT